MLRRQLLKTTALAVAGAMAEGLRAPKTAAGQLTAQEREAFVRAVSPIYGEARSEYGRDLLGLEGLQALQSGFGSIVQID